MSRLISPRYLLMVILLGCVQMTYAAVNDAAVATVWGYKGNVGPKYWGRLHPSFTLCGAGRAQSPIDIAKNTMQVPNTLTLHYHAVPLEIVDDGTINLRIGNEHYLLNDGHSIQVNYDHRADETIAYRGGVYRLREFHFHSPSENQINGENAPLEIHFVHSNDKGGVVVIGVLVTAGEPNPALQVIIDHLPAEKGKVVKFPQISLNPRSLLPLDDDYYSFMGSLTTPPCTEDLQWVVMASTMTASPAQLAILRKAVGGVNARPVQPLNKRQVAYSIGKMS